MAKIRGRFAPLFEELGNDSRWLLDLDDDGKLLYNLILMTIYFTNNAAPDDLRYYVIRYNLRCPNGQLRTRYHKSMKALSKRYEQIKSMFPKLVCENKKLSLLNYRGYENRVDRPKPLEVEEEKEIEKEIEYSMDFLTFWKSYPNKKKKGYAYKSWKKINPKGELLKKILAAVEVAKQSKDWKKDGGQYIPHPSTWLNSRGWEDEHDPDAGLTTAERIERIAERAKQVQKTV